MKELLKRPNLSTSKLKNLFSTEMRLAIESVATGALTHSGLQVSSIRIKAGTTFETASFEITYLVEDGNLTIGKNQVKSVRIFTHGISRKKHSYQQLF